MALVGSLVVSLTANTQPFQQGMGQSATAVKQLQQTTVSAQASIAGLERAMMGLAAQYIGINALRDALVSLVQAGSRMESLKITMSNVFGGQAAAETALRKTRSVADQLGLSAEETARGFTNLTAAARGTAVEGATTEKIFMQLVSITRALGKSTQDTSGVLLAAQQILTKGTVMAEEFRGQLGERLPGILQAGAKTMGTSLEGFSKMMERGELGAKHFAAIVQTMFDDVGRNAIASADTTESAMNRMGNAWTKLGEQFVAGPVGKFMKDSLTVITMALEGWSIIFEKMGRLQGGMPVPSMERRQFITEGFVDEKSPEFQKLELIATKASIVARMIYDLDQNLQALGPDENAINKMAKLEKTLMDLNAQYQAQRERVIALNDIGKQYRENLDAALKVEEERRRAMERLTNALSQTSSKIKELREIQDDFARRTAEQPEQKEFFARDFLSDTKKVFDFLTLQLSRIKKQVDEQPAITFKQGAEFEQLKAAVAALTKGREDATNFLKDIEELERGMKRVLAIQDETAKMTLGPEGAQLTADARRRENEEAIRGVLRLAGVSMEAARAEVARQQVVADNARFEAEAVRVAGEGIDRRQKQFDDLLEELMKQRRALLETKQSWLDYQLAIRTLKPEDEEFLRGVAAKNASLKDFTVQLTETMQRVLSLQQETAKLTFGPDAAEDMGVEMQQAIEKQTDSLKELAQTSEMAARAVLRGLLAITRARFDDAEAVRVQGDIDKMRERQFKDILEALQQQRRSLLETRQSWLDLKIAQATLQPDEEQKLRDDAAKIRETQDTALFLSETMQRVLQVRTEIDKLTAGPDASEDMAIQRRVDAERELDQLKELAQVSEMAARGRVRALLELAREELHHAEGVRVNLDIEKSREKQFADINALLDEERRNLLKVADSAFQEVLAKATLTAADEQFLRTKNEVNQAIREGLKISEDNAARERELAQMYDSTRDEIDQLILSEEELFRKRAARATEAPFSRIITPLAEPTELQTELSAMFERARFSNIPPALTAAQEQLGSETARRAIRDLRDQQNATVNDMIRSLFDQNRALRLTTEQLAEYELALNNADDAQKDLVRSMIDKNKIANFASSLSDFAIDFVTKDAFELIKGRPASDKLGADRLRLKQLKDDIAEAEARLAMTTPTSPMMLESMRKQKDALTDFKQEYASLQESIRQETAKTESVFEHYISKLSSFLLKLFLDTSEAGKSVTNLINKGIQGVLTILGAVSSAGAITAGNIDIGTTAAVAGAEGISTPPPLIFKQHGGRFFRGQPMIAGEMGPELILPTVPGVVLTSSQTRSVMTAGAPQVNVYISTPNAQSFQQSRGQVSRAILNAISQAQRSL